MTNKPEVSAYATHHDEPMLFPDKKEAAAYCEDGEEPVALIRLSDYEALQAEYRMLESELATVKTASLDVDTLAKIIRKVDGNNSLGAGVLAERIVAELVRLEKPDVSPA